MPELPEVETIARGLADRLPGHEIRGVEVTHADVLAPPLTPPRLARRLKGRRIDDVRRHGKNVLLRLAPAADAEAGLAKDVLRMLINLGMTGRLVLDDSPAAAALRHIAVRFRLDDGALLYDDVRRFGRIELHDPESWAGRIETIGIDPMSDAFTAAALHALTSRSRTPIRTWLLDQRRIAGVGNIYASEALFRAGIHPARRASTLGGNEAVRLRDALRGVLEEAVEARGTTFSDYVDAAGETGGFAVRLQVYDREGEPCVRCATPIERTVITNRSAFLCPGCQPTQA